MNDPRVLFIDFLEKMYNKNSIAQQLRKRTNAFALDVVALVGEMPNRTEFFVLGKQVLKSATSVAANYRAASRARSQNEFYSKLCIVVEEADETIFWLELLRDSGLINENRLKDVIIEAEELTAIMAKSRKTVSRRLGEPLENYRSISEEISLDDLAEAEGIYKFSNSLIQ